ncbi:unnamed protein product [Prunus armeniaca]|uniref:Uncharacterized protein n=1 Tax=Prunus armeniaca TaxID=36596 RepID=A0A6J5XEN1_PRUAR|nr:unnamed protein product [Prunus armeniaca]CAB4310502.1 unnamed protein product [Prunus armeniaca]
MSFRQAGPPLAASATPSSLSVGPAPSLGTPPMLSCSGDPCTLSNSTTATATATPHPPS